MGVPRADFRLLPLEEPQHIFYLLSCVLAVHRPNRLQLGPVVSAQHVIALSMFLSISYGLHTLLFLPYQFLVWTYVFFCGRWPHDCILSITEASLGCLLAGWQLPARGTQEAIPHHTVMGDGLDIGQLYATWDKCQLQQYIMNIHEVTYHYLSLQIFYSNGKFCCSILKLILSSLSNASMVNPIIY